MSHERRLDRRAFLIGGGVALSAAGLAALRFASGSPAPTDASIATPANLNLPPQKNNQITEITGTFPPDKFHYSDAIKNNGLVPAILPEGLVGIDKMQAGVDYIKRAITAFERIPNVPQVMLGDLHITAPYNFPVALHSTDTILDVMKGLTDDIRTQRVLLWGSVKNADYLLGTVNEAHLNGNNQWTIQSKITADADFPIGGTQKEENGTIYNRYSDLQIALKLLHEYTHCKQGEKVLKTVLVKYGENLKHVENPEEYASALLDSEASLINADMNTSPQLDPNKRVGLISFNEAQANQVAQLLLWTLNSVNTYRMPGTADDPFPVTNTSLYRTYERAIIQGKNIFDMDWLNMHANWNK